MTKQEFLAMSLPYGLKCCTAEITRINDLISCHFGNMVLARVKPNDNVDFPLPIEQIKPIVRPLSDLTKEIEHKGEKFVPIIELAKVAFTNSRYSFKLSEGLDKFVWIDDDWNNFKFYFEGYNFHYDGYNRFIPNQFKLYQKLIEWHFDIADLISKGEAIDVNTLEENPYK